MRSNRLLLCFYWLLAAAILSGCVEKRSVLMDDPVCQYPCWQNITPGRTTFVQAVEILSQSMFFDSKGFSPTPSQIIEAYGYSSWVFTKSVREMGLVLYNIDDYVVLLDFSVSRNIHIEEMMDFYGEPELISVISGTAGSRWLDASWIYPSKGVVISLFDYRWKPEGAYARITPEMDIFDVYYFDTDAYESLMEKGMIIHNYWDIIQKSIQPWNGYGLVPYVEE